ncbi:MAG: glutaredoxin family protein [Betaproteobacteria bacterium]|nr:glutaredoxin family protein [Betaproteobacteria bacterium]
MPEHTFLPARRAFSTSAARRALAALATLLALASATVPALAANDVAPAAATSRTLEVFVRDGCPHCADAKAFLGKLSSTRTDLSIVYRPVDRDPAAREALFTLSERAGVWPPGVPTFVIDGRVMVGFDAEQGGSALAALIDDRAPRGEQVETTAFGTLSASRLGLPLFTLALGLIDGFNPCATWVLLFLLSLLVRFRDRRRMALVAGTFVLASGAVYFAFMAAWLNLFLIAGMSTPLRWGLALIALAIGAFNVKDFFARGHGPSLSIPDAAKPGIYARMRAVMSAEAIGASLVAVAALAVVVNFVEILCTAGLPAVFTAVLAQHDLTPAARYGYLALYIAGYIADDALMVTVAVVALGNRKLSERGGRWLKLASGAVMIALGLAMLLRPEWLS